MGLSIGDPKQYSGTCYKENLGLTTGKGIVRPDK